MVAAAKQSKTEQDKTLPVRLRGHVGKSAWDLGLFLAAVDASGEREGAKGPEWMRKFQGGEVRTQRTKTKLRNLFLIQRETLWTTVSWGLGVWTLRFRERTVRFTSNLPLEG